MNLPPIPLFLSDRGVPGELVSHLEVEVHFREVEGRIDVAEIRLISHDDSRPITAEMWRGIRIGEVVAHARSGLSAVLKLAATVEPAEELRRHGEEAPRRIGRPRGLPDDLLLEVAAVYNEARRLQPGRARLVVAEHFIAKDPMKYRGVDRRNNHTVKSWIQAATNRGFIPRKAG